MKHALATLEPEVPEVPVALVDIPITVNVDFAGNVTINQPYVSVQQDGANTITWTLETELPDVLFDKPAVSMFGEGADLDIEDVSPTVRRVTWHNTDVSKQGRSFFYRVHLLQKVGSTFRPLSTDPIVHNDPPS